MREWIVYSVISLIAWGVWGVALKIAEREMEVAWVYFISSLASFTFSILVTIFVLKALSSQPNISFRGVAYALLAGALGSLGYIMIVKALEHGDASIVITVTALYPAVTIALGVLMGERISLVKAIGLLLAVVSIVLISSG